MRGLEEPFDRPLGLRESPRLSTDIQRLLKGFKRWEEIMETMSLDIARFPYRCQNVPGTDLYAIRLLTTPPTTLFFTVDGKAGLITLEALF